MGNYSRGIIFPSFLAPAATQSFASAMMVLSRMGVGALLWRKTREFLSFQIVQNTIMVREAMAFLLGLFKPVLEAHQSFTESSTCQEVVSICASPSFAVSKFQCLTVNRHLKKRCDLDSCTRLQRGQSPQFVHPPFSILSAVHTLSCKANQARNLNLGGTQAFHIICSIKIGLCMPMPPNSFHL